MGRMDIKVVPNASKNRVLVKDGQVVVYVNAPPEKGKANRALLKLLKRITGDKVDILSGEKSRKKTISFSLREEEFLKRLKENERTD